MPVIRTVKGFPQGRFEITSLQRETLGKMIDRGIFSYTDLAKHLRISARTLSKTLRGRRANPLVLKKLLRFLDKETEAPRKVA